MKPPKVPKPIIPPGPPTINQARIDQERNDQVLGRKGRMATFVSNAMGRSAGGVSYKALMGQGG